MKSSFGGYFNRRQPSWHRGVKEPISYEIRSSRDDLIKIPIGACEKLLLFLRGSHMGVSTTQHIDFHSVCSSRHGPILG